MAGLKSPSRGVHSKTDAKVGLIRINFSDPNSQPEPPMGYFRLVRHRAARERISGQTAKMQNRASFTLSGLLAEKHKFLAGHHKDSIVMVS